MPPQVCSGAWTAPLGVALGVLGVLACGSPRPAAPGGTVSSSPAPPAAYTEVSSAAASTSSLEAAACVSAKSDHTHVPRPTGSPNAAAARVSHVIILSEDGLRPDALAEAGAPTHDLLMREGSYTLRAKTIRRASTLPSHAAMLSGFDVEEHGLDWNSWRPERGYIRVPTVLTAAVHAGKGAAAFVGKWKLAHIAEPGSVDVFSRPGYLCKKVVDEAASYFLSRKPQVLFVHFSDPDEEGHAVGWMSEPQLKAVRSSDKCLATLMEAIRKSDVAERTLLIISADHGGFGRNHSGARSEDRLIPWIAWGAGVRRGHRIAQPVSTVDTAATALWALGYAPPHGLAGHPVLEAFENP